MVVKESEFEFPVIQFLKFETVFVVLLQIPNGHPDVSRNVRAYDLKGNEVWRIKSDEYNPNFGYVGISKDNGKLRVINFSTIQLLIDPVDGSVLKQEWVK